MKLGWNLTSHLNHNLTAWIDPSDSTSGYYSMALDVEGDPKIFLWGGACRLWRTGPWVGQRFSGIPEMKTYSMFTFNFVMDRDEIYYTFNILDRTVISRLIVNQSGVRAQVADELGSKGWVRWVQEEDRVGLPK
ncbi:putative G-type lectin S-receptor-like serine/threonine-protein kinase [Cocos nucifera]|nr:putative G-type lectin S-receptor-like serine/threonine-protein kinase [Cocos nucifera]